jgi:peptide-methionine (S)-S-oxide reductase
MMTGTKESLVLAGGCFWDMRELIGLHPGVISVRECQVGASRPCGTSRRGKTDEQMVEVVFDSEQTSCRDLLLIYFEGKGAVAPICPDRGSDVGNLHRSAILELSAEERFMAEGAYVAVGAGGLWSGNVVW